MFNKGRSQILALRVIQQIWADKRTVVLMTIIPVILLSFIGILIRHDPAKLVVGVVNNDDGFAMMGNEVNLGDRLIEVLGSFEEFDAQVMTTDEARDQLDAADADAVITVPPEFTQNVISTRTLTLDIEYEGSNPMLSERLNTIFARVALQTANTLALVGSSTASDLPLDPSSIEFATAIDATYLHSGPEYDTLDYMAPALIGFFVFFLVFLLTCISFLRERVVGTLERLQATPIRPHEIIIGYMLGFMVFGIFQGTITLVFTVFILDIHYAGNLLNIFVVEALLVMLSVNLGILLSTFAQNEFQVLQFIPLIVTSQGLLGGVIWQIEDMPGWLQPVSYVMPLTYANEALRKVMINGDSLLDVWFPVLVLIGFAVVVIGLASRTAGRAKI
ncbi:MAG: ABC-2 transporter permease [Anaerolineae bacterium]|nr:ABC-2 transporter permease [Anaerolineae bacterium]